MCQLNIYQCECPEDADEHVAAMEEDGWVLKSRSWNPATETGHVLMVRAQCPEEPLADARSRAQSGA